MDIRQFMKWKSISDSRSVENISEKRLIIEVQPVQTNGVERVKRFLNVHLHCIVSNLKRISKISMLPLTWKNFCGRPCPPTAVGSDGDLFLLLTFCQNVLLVLSACNAAASPLTLCISTSLRHYRSEYLKSFFVSTMFLHMPPVLGLL